MKKKTLREVIDSLTNSTEFTISLRQETVAFDHRYGTKHRSTIEIGKGHGVPDLVVIENDEDKILIIPGDCHTFEDRLSVELSELDMNNLFPWPIHKPEWVDGMVTIISVPAQK